MLYGRREERALITGLLAGARAGRSGVLVIHGDAGVGKRALLEDAAGQAEKFRLLRGLGVESEVELSFGALHQLLRPFLDRLDRLPAPQAAALRGAFGLADARASRFLVELGALSLLAEVAAEQPVLCMVADAEWLDPASADALVFVARRLQAERVVLLVAARNDDLRQFPAPGLPELRLAGLGFAAAAELLKARVGKLAATVRDRLIEETGGNPLALLELPAALSAGQLAGREPLPEHLPLSARLQQAFLRRVRRLPRATQTLLLVAATEDTGELATLLAAARTLAAGPDALEPAERAGLVEIADAALRFRHPLLRSAVYQAATFTARQAAHRALANVLAGARQADRRAWHQAATTVDADEDVAKALERSAERALALLDQVEPGPADPAVRARIASVHGRVELAAGTPATACTLLVEGAKPILTSDPRQVTEMLVLATWAALAAGELDRIVEEIHPAVARTPGQEDVRVEGVADSLHAAGLGHATPATAVDLPPTAAATWPHPAFTWMWPMLVVAEPAADERTAEQRYAGSVAARRTAGTVSSLTVALANLAMAEASLGRLPDTIDHATEGLRLARETGQPATAGYFLAMLAGIAAHQGRTDDCRLLAGEALAAATPRRLTVVAALASWTLALLDLTEGRPAAALDRLRALAIPGHPIAHAPIALLATGTLVEAAARAGALEGMQPHVAKLERWAQWDRRTWTVMVARRCRALITPGDDAERHFQAALATDGIGELPLELARTELLYGEWLRRMRRRTGARPHLRTALELYERLGAIPWADRARGELRASGETARKRDPSTFTELTPQERQVARLAVQGLTNQQIAARLFLSRHTVSYHLHKLYLKLGIVSRIDLRQLDLDDDAGR